MNRNLNRERKGRPIVTKHQLQVHTSQRTNRVQRDVVQVTNAFLDALTEACASGALVTLNNMGRFIMVERTIYPAVFTGPKTNKQYVGKGTPRQVKRLQFYPSKKWSKK
jgi:nucleoid DNA-binding protein